MNKIIYIFCFLVFVISCKRDAKVFFSSNNLEIEKSKTEYISYEEILKSGFDTTYLVRNAYRWKIIPEFFIENKIDWTEIDTNINEELKNILKNKIVIKKTKDVHLPIGGILHYTDFNLDNYIDIIILGQFLGEGTYSSFFENQGDSLRLILRLQGCIIEFDKSKKETLSFVVWDWPCCANTVNSIDFYEYKYSSKIKYNDNIDDCGKCKFIKNYYPNFYKSNSLNYFRNSFIPDSAKYFKPIGTFKVTKDSTLFLNIPKYNINIFDSEIDIVSYPDTVVIHFAYLNEGAKGEIYSVESKTENFYFIKTKNTTILYKDHWKKSYDFENFFGWVRAEDVEAEFY
jgi:hypothetical protein